MIAVATIRRGTRNHTLALGGKAAKFREQCRLHEATRLLLATGAVTRVRTRYE